MCKELIVYQDCIWYISCKCMYVCMPRAIYASGWFSTGFPKYTYLVYTTVLLVV